VHNLALVTQKALENNLPSYCTLNSTGRCKAAKVLHAQRELHKIFTVSQSLYDGKVQHVQRDEMGEM
jgi:hypothetical protein